MSGMRVFISFSHEDRVLAERVAQLLKELGLQPLWSREIRPGTAFSESIKGMISHAHIFMPLITENSQSRPWVHQETGYAMALNIPVLPVAFGAQPGEMISQLQAVVVDPEDLTELKDRLQGPHLEQIVLPPPQRPQALVEVAEWPEIRAQWLAQYANRVVELGGYAVLRQRGAFSSFCIPDEEIDHPVWKEREHPTPRSDYYHFLQREERRAFERHAREAGCRLIIDPTLRPKDFPDRVTTVRLETLRDALSSLPEGRIEVAVHPRAREGSSTIIGDWFMAESMVPRPGGYRQTVFTWHAPTVLRAVRRFDEQFEALCARGDFRDRSSRDVAVARIQEEIDRLASTDPAPHTAGGSGRASPPPGESPGSRGSASCSG